VVLLDCGGGTLDSGAWLIERGDPLRLGQEVIPVIGQFPRSQAELLLIICQEGSSAPQTSTNALPEWRSKTYEMKYTWKTSRTDRPFKTSYMEISCADSRTTTNVPLMF
jgi:hypothetical protein